MEKLQLPLKTKWFEMTKEGIKKEDYRSLTPYWAKRLVGTWVYCGEGLGQFPKLENSFMSSHLIHSIKPFTINRMTLGYPSKEDKSRILELEHKGIEIREGNPDWGAEKGVLYFCIMHGDILEQ